MTPIEYCRAVRIARARELLEGGDTSQKQIAQSLGYKDVASFARVFRKAVGSAPGAYRKRFGRNGISPADVVAKKWLHVGRSTYSRPGLILAERVTVIRRPAVSYVRDRHITSIAGLIGSAAVEG